MFEALKDKLRVEWHVRENYEPVSVDTGDERWNQHLAKLIEKQMEGGDLFAWGVVTVMATLGPFQEMKQMPVACTGGKDEFENKILPPLVELLVERINVKAQMVAQDAAMLMAVLTEEGKTE